jgi:hypothetical protein
MIDEDGSSSTGLFGVLQDMIKAHPLIPIELACHITESVSTQFGDETNIRIESGCGDSLVRALAARAHFKRLTQNSLTPLRHSAGSTGKIGYKRA